MESESTHKSILTVKVEGIKNKVLFECTQGKDAYHSRNILTEELFVIFESTISGRSDIIEPEATGMYLKIKVEKMRIEDEEQICFEHNGSMLLIEPNELTQLAARRTLRDWIGLL